MTFLKSLLDTPLMPFSVKQHQQASAKLKALREQKQNAALNRARYLGIR
jgi:hypothetical protein